MENYLIHHGIKGMKWGVRRYRNYDGTLTPLGKRRLQKEASKDAKEFARAKMFYGEGAGNRRKLIKATVNQKSKDEYYKKAFEEALANQDMAKHAAKARAERKRKDAKAATAKTARGVYHTLAGDGARVSALVGTAVAAGTILHATGADKKIIDVGKQFLKNASAFRTVSWADFARDTFE